MNYGAFTNDSIAMMYEAARGALATDDTLERQGQETRFRVRETPEWKKHGETPSGGSRRSISKLHLYLQ
jgi:hypothetical protein